MAKRTLKITLAVLLAISLYRRQLIACGWFEQYETYRISMFRAEIAGMQYYRPFYYTPDLMYEGFSPERNNDWLKNCNEWNKILGNKLIINDIYTILYQVDPEMFVLAYNDQYLAETFEDNTFINALLQSKNKDWLDYLVFAKKNEYNNQFIDDPWNSSYGEAGTIQSELIVLADLRLKQSKDQKLSERYAYHLVRLYRQAGQNKECIALFNKYFENNQNTVLKYWAMLHKAEALSAIGKADEANYLYSLVFNSSSEKRVRAFKLFDTKNFTKCLSLAKNKDEIAGIWALLAISNPGPALDQIKKIIENNPSHHAIPVLIMREVNKLEDWIFTPQMTSYGPSLDLRFDKWYDQEEYDKIKDINKIKDLKYLDELNQYLEIIQKSTKPELSDYLTIARAHLYLLANKTSEALALFNQIKENANPSILIQKHTELALYYCFEKKIKDEKVKEELAKTLINLENIAKNNNDYMKQLHSLCEALSRGFRMDGDIVSAALLKLKAESFKSAYESERTNWYDNYLSNQYYWPIAYLDRFASPTDIDKLIALSEKKHKTLFEEFITNQPIASKNALMDLKGTLALRLGDIKLALSAFNTLPADYWDSTYEFNQYLDQNPFLAPNTNDYNEPFKFNKAKVLLELVNLKNEAESNSNKAVENYLKIGHFFYNASYWGNSWMMLSYSRTCSPVNDWGGFYYQDALFGDLLDNAQNFVDSYYKCSLAKQYYQKAAQLAKNKEQKAMILFMQYCCDLNNYRWQQMQKGWGEGWDDYKPNYLGELYKNYQDTKTFREVNCSLMDDYAIQIGVY